MTQPAAAPVLLGPDAPVIPRRLRVNDDAPAPRYGDDVWKLDALGRAPGHRSLTLAWRQPEPGMSEYRLRQTWPASPLLMEGIRALAWLFVNVARPGETAFGDDSAQRGPRAGTVVGLVATLRHLAKYLHDHGTEAFSDADDDVLMGYREHLLASGIKDKGRYLANVGVLWEYAPHLPEHARLRAEPPWLAEASRPDTVPSDAAAGDDDDRNEPLHPATMSPLLLWALRFVEDFADDVLRAWDERRRLHASVPAKGRDAAADAATVMAYVKRLRAEGKPLPGEATPKGRITSNRYIAGLLGVPWKPVARRCMPSVSGLPTGTETPLGTRVDGLVHGTPWTDGIHYGDARAMLSLLVTACQVVIGYLSGMRTEELLALRSGCCPAPSPDDARHRIHGTYFKGAKHPDGTPAPEGLPRSWIVIPQVRDAVMVMERIVGKDGGALLFPADGPWVKRTGQSKRPGMAMTTTAVNQGIARLIDWVNARADADGLVAERVPPDPRGPVNARRLRRTVAWWVYRRPRGRIALGVQYGHLDLAVTDIYGNRQRELDGVFEMERGRMFADSLERAVDAADRGEHVSGPSKAYNENAQAGYRKEYRGTFLGNPGKLRKLANDPTKQVRYDPHHLLTCNPQAGLMACQENRPLRVEQTPDPLLCQSRCACITRTDSDIAQIDAERRGLLARADSGLLPDPMADRLRQQAADKQTIIDRHEDSRRSASGEGAA